MNNIAGLQYIPGHMPLSCAAVIQRDFVDRDYSVV
jgi:hypothetical protein